MKKIFLAGLLVCGFAITQAQVFTGYGDKKLNLGLAAFGNGVGVNASFDYGLSNIFSAGVGAELYFNDKADEDFYIYGRGDAHLSEILSLPSQLDLYPGVDLGLHGGNIGVGGHIGVRYFFSDVIGAYAELGSRGNIGLTINL